MKNKLKPLLRRWMIRQLIKLVDRAEDRLQIWQVELRDGLKSIPVHHAMESSRPARPQKPTVSCPYPFPQDELLRHRISRRTARDREQERAEESPRRRMTAAEFDLRFVLTNPEEKGFAR